MDISPLQNRFGVDQGPLELNRRDFTFEERGTTDRVYIRGPKKDLDKRQATLQVCVRVKGDQIVAPTLIFQNANPAENRFKKKMSPREQRNHAVSKRKHLIVSRIFQTDGHERRLLVFMKNNPAEEFPKAFGYKSGPRNTIFRFVGERSGTGLKNSLKMMQTKKVTQKEVLMNLIKSDALCLQK